MIKTYITLTTAALALFLSGGACSPKSSGPQANVVSNVTQLPKRPDPASPNSPAPTADSGAPAAAVRKWHDAMVAGDINAVLACYSGNYIQKGGGIEKTKTGLIGGIQNEQTIVKKTGRPSELIKIKETINENNAEVSFEEADAGSSSGFPVTVKLVKEDGLWKIDEFDWR